MIGGISVGLGGPGGAVASVVGRYRRLAHWAATRSVGPTSVSGVALVLGICAAGWFTAGTRQANVNGAVSLAAAYLATLGARELAGHLGRRLAGRQPASAVAHPVPTRDGPLQQAAAGPGSKTAGGLSARAAARLDRVVRAGWLAVLGGRLSDCAVYAGLAIGAIAQGWTGIWPLAMAVLALTAIRDTMTACSGLASPAWVLPDSAVAGSAVAGSADAGSAVAGSAESQSANADSAHADSADTDSADADSVYAGSADTDSADARSAVYADSGDDDLADADSADDGSVPAGSVREHPVNRLIVAVLTMPPGGRMLLIAVAAPVWGARASLLGLLDWGIIAIGYGIGGETVARRRDRKPRRRVQRRVQRRMQRPQPEPGPLSVLLQPPRPPDPAEFRTARPAGQPISVLRLELSPAPPGLGPRADPRPADLRPADPRLAKPGLAESGKAESRKTESRKAGTKKAATEPAGGGLADIGLAGLGLADSEAARPGFATSNEPGTGFATSSEAGTRFAGSDDAGTGFGDRAYPFGSSAEGWSADRASADRVSTGRASTDHGSTDHGFAGHEFSGHGVTGHDGADGFLADGEFDLSDGPGSAPAAAPAANGNSHDRSLAVVLRCRDDGAISRWFGRLVRGQLMPLPPALLALAAVATLAHLGLRDLPGILILAPAIVMLVAAPGSSHAHGGRFDWLVPAVLAGAQYIYIVALGLATGVPPPLTFALCAAIALRYADLGAAGSPVLPARRGAAAGSVPATALAVAGSAGPERGAWMGWEGRMLVCGLGAAMGITMFAYVALAAYVAGVVGWKIMASGLSLPEGDRQ